MKPRVDYYLFDSEDTNQRLLFICRLLEKAYQKKHRIFVYCEDQEQAETLDELLWTFKEGSFIPHNIQGEGPEPPPAIQIGFSHEPRGFNDILINLSDKKPSFYPRFQRVMEVIGNQPNARDLARDHFRQYRKEGCEMFTHEVR